MAVVRDGSLAWVLLNRTYVHLPRRSGWNVASTTGWDASLGTPWIKLAANRAGIQIPIYKADDSGTRTEAHVLTGRGVGVSAGLNIQLPFVSYSWSTSDDPGRGTPIFESPFCPEPVEVSTFQRACYLVSMDAVRPSDGLAGRQLTGSLLIFVDRIGPGLLLPTSINGVAFVIGLGASGVNFGGVGAEALIFDLSP